MEPSENCVAHLIPTRFAITNKSYQRKCKEFVRCDLHSWAAPSSMKGEGSMGREGGA